MNPDEIADLAAAQRAGSFSTESDARTALMLIENLCRYLMLPRELQATPTEPLP